MSKTILRIAITATLAVGLPLGLMTATAASASVTRPQAAINASCYGYSCHGRDPSVYGCSDSTTTFKGTSLVSVWNDYANNCGANWAVGELTSTGLAAHDSFQLAAATTDRYGQQEFECVPGPSDTGDLTEYCNNTTIGGSGAAFSDMVDGQNVADAIAYVYNSAGRLIQTVVAPQ